jgi:hypothetical protein
LPLSHLQFWKSYLQAFQGSRRLSGEFDAAHPIDEAHNFPLGEQGTGAFRPEGAIRNALFHPDYTVGSGLAPDLLTFRLEPEALAGSGITPDTAGGEFHPALRTA